MRTQHIRGVTSGGRGLAPASGRSSCRLPAAFDADFRGRKNNQSSDVCHDDGGGLRYGIGGATPSSSCCGCCR